MLKRLTILKNSLIKKEAKLDEKFSNHFATVREANGQPLNDKRNGRATLDKWERQNDSIRSLQESIEVTKSAIDKEECKINYCEFVKDLIPNEVTELITEGVLIQWRKHPHIFFVNGVDKARLVWDSKKNNISHKYTGSITDKEQWKTFAKIFNSLNQSINNVGAK